MQSPVSILSCSLVLFYQGIVFSVKETAAGSSPEINTTIIPPSTKKITPSSFPAINFAECGKSYSCVRKGFNCASISSCDAVAIFHLLKDKQVALIQIATRHQYVAFGQKVHKDTDVMVKVRGEYCAKGRGIQFGNFHGNDLTENDMPAFVENVNGVVLIDSIVDKNNVLICKYKRIIKPTSENEQYLYNFNEKLYTLITFGKSMDESKPGYHGFGNYLVTSKKIDYFSNVDIISDGMTSANKAHGILMIIAYIVLASAGIFISRYLKGVTSDKRIKGKAVWFPLHVLVMLLCLLFMIIAFITIIAEMDGSFPDAGRHHYTGLFAIIAMLMQPVMALARPAPDHKWRFIFNYTHRFVGISGWLLCGIAVIFAFEMIGQNYGLPIAFIVVTIAICFLLDILLFRFFNGGKYEMFVNTNAEGQAEAKVGIAVNLKQKNYLLLLFFLIQMTFALVVAIYLSYIICTF